MIKIRIMSCLLTQHQQMLFVTHVLKFVNLKKLGEPYVEVLYVVYLRDVQWIQEQRSALNVQTSNTRNISTNSKSANMIVLRNWLMLESTAKQKFIFKLKTSSQPTKIALLNQ